MNQVVALLPMAGRGIRFDSPVSKQFHPLRGRPLFLWTLEKLYNSKLFDEIILICAPDHITSVQEAIEGKAIVTQGGKTRQESVYNGLVRAGDETEIILIHDAVRPFVTQKILEDNIQAARDHGAADTCIPSTDTLVHTSNGNTIESIPNRSHLLRGQTPQTFNYSVILKAHQKTTKTNATDDCQLVFDLGYPVHIVAGDERNIKVTNPQDLTFAEQLLGHNCPIH